MRGGRWVEKNASEARGGRRCARLRRAGERAEGGEGSRERARAAERDSIADGTALWNIVGEEVAATFGDTEDLFPEGSLFMSLRAIGYLLTHAECLLSVRQKKENFAEQRHRGHYPRHTSSNAVWLKVLGYAPLSPKIENVLGTPQL